MPRAQRRDRRVISAHVAEGAVRTRVVLYVLSQEVHDASQVRQKDGPSAAKRGGGKAEEARAAPELPHSHVGAGLRLAQARAEARPGAREGEEARADDRGVPHRRPRQRGVRLLVALPLPLRAAGHGRLLHADGRVALADLQLVVLLELFRVGEPGATPGGVLRGERGVESFLLACGVCARWRSAAVSVAENKVRVGNGVEQMGCSIWFCGRRTSQGSSSSLAAGSGSSRCLAAAAAAGAAAASSSMPMGACPSCCVRRAACTQSRGEQPVNGREKPNRHTSPLLVNSLQELSACTVHEQELRSMLTAGPHQHAGAGEPLGNPKRGK